MREKCVKKKSFHFATFSAEIYFSRGPFSRTFHGTSEAIVHARHFHFSRSFHAAVRAHFSRRHWVLKSRAPRRSFTPAFPRDAEQVSASRPSIRQRSMQFKKKNLKNLSANIGLPMRFFTQFSLCHLLSLSEEL